MVGIFSTVVIVPTNLVEAQESVFSDPSGGFTVNVPTGWKAEPAQNRSEVRFMPESGNASMNILVAEDNANITTDDSGLMEFAELELSTGFGISDMKVEQDVECETYTVQGNEACSYIISTEQYTEGKDLVIIQIITLIDGIRYYFSYGDFRDDFDGQLPIFEDLVDSFRTPAPEEAEEEESDEEEEPEVE